MKGDGYQNGGSLVVEVGGEKTLLHYIQKEAPDHVNNADVLKVKVINMQITPKIRCQGNRNIVVLLGNDLEIEFQEIEIGVFQEIEKALGVRSSQRKNFDPLNNFCKKILSFSCFELLKFDLLTPTRFSKLSTFLEHHLKAFKD